ncbi:hypothetical protein ACFL1M_04640 [Patescibacteria group bacterium]
MKSRKPVSRQVLYSMLSMHTKEAISRTRILMDSNNENIALGACKLLLNKTLPDVKAIAINDFQQETNQDAVLNNEPELSTEEMIKKAKEAIKALEEDQSYLLENSVGEIIR